MNTKVTTVLIIALIMGSIIMYYLKFNYKLGVKIKPSSTVVEKKYEMSNIHKIYSSDGIIVHYSQQQAEDILVKGPENVVSALKVSKSTDGLLKLEMLTGDRFDYLSEKEHVNVWISKPDINYFQAVSKSCIYISDTLRSFKDISIGTYSGAFIQLSAIQAPMIQLESYTDSNIVAYSIRTETLRVKAFTKSEIRLFGFASRVKFTASSASIDASNLYADKGAALAMSGGNIRSVISDADIEEFTGGHISNNNLE